MKRTITFIARNSDRIKTYRQTIKFGKFKYTTVVKSMVETDYGYVDLSVTVDRWGRVINVGTERARRR